MPAPVAILVKGYPRLSETFIAQELAALQEMGLDFEIISLRHPTDGKRHPVHERIRAPVNYLPEYLWQEPGRVFKGWWRARRMSGYRQALALWWRDLRRDPTPNRGRRFGQALVLAAELDPRIAHLHAHFLHTPASVARYAAVITGREWSVSAHAKDIWTTPDWEKREKLAEMAWGVTCSAYGHGELERCHPGTMELAYHGLDLSDLPPPPPGRSQRDGRDWSDPIQLLSVGRAVEKKGFDVLLRALARLPAELNWRWMHVGGGNRAKNLKTLAGELGLSDRVEWRGAQDRGAVIAACRAADLFILPSRIASDGDRDGLPNVLMEAQSQDLCCLASEVAAVPELIRHGEGGWLVPPDDPDALASALSALISDPARRLALGACGGERLRAEFDHRVGLGILARHFDLDRTRNDGGEPDLTDRDAAE